MKKGKDGRISLTRKEAEDIYECLESYASMCGTLDEDFNAETKMAERLAKNLQLHLYGKKGGYQFSDNKINPELKFITR
ncbi:MAG: hypothetical protein HDS31_01775 [Bacteroides sp.]|nr:hypothetical protein [Bacteroides sp.]